MSFAASAQQRPSGPEFYWALLHPFAAIKVKKITRACDEIYRKAPLNPRLDNFASGGRLDAFRHVFYMAAYAQKIAVRKIRKLGIAHEKGNYRQFKRGQLEEGEGPDSVASVMDIQNNELGLALGCNHRQRSLQDLSEIVVADIAAGKAVIMKRIKKGNYLDCTDNKITLENFRGKWHVPKCLVKSDFSYPD